MGKVIVPRSFWIIVVSLLTISSHGVEASSGASLTIRGTVQVDGMPLPAVWLTGLPGGVVTQVDGTYIGQIPDGWSGTIEPRWPGYDFTPERFDVPPLAGDLVLDFTATEKPIGCQRLFWVRDNNDFTRLDFDSSPGDLALIEPGIYSRSFSEIDDLVFLGRGGADQTIWDDRSLLNDNRLLFEGIGFQAPDGQHASEIGTASQVRFRNCRFRSTAGGNATRFLSSSSGSSELLFEGSEWSGNGIALLLREDSVRGDMTIRQSTITGDNYGITAADTPELQLTIANTRIGNLTRDGVDIGPARSFDVQNVIVHNTDVGLRFDNVTCPVDIGQAVLYENGDGLRANDSVDVTIHDSIFASNSCGIDGASNATVNLDHLVYTGGWLWAGPDYNIDASSITEADPMFTDADGGDFTLLPGSPAIGAGRNGQNLGAFGGPLGDAWAPPPPLAEPMLQSAILLAAPRHLGVGIATTYRVEGRFSHGFVGDVNDGATWTSSDPAVLSALGNGTFEAVAEGNADAIATIDLGNGQPVVEARVGVVVVATGVFSPPSQDPPLEDDQPLPAETAAEGFNEVSGWALADPLDAGREEHTATLLHDGRVLVAGGRSGGTATASTEIYDPVAGRWSQAAPMSTARISHAAALLTDGRVLVAGNAFPNAASCEIYDPLTNTWSDAASLNVERSGHTVNVLDSGFVLVVAGNGASSSAEIYDPVADQWFLTGPLNTNHFGHTSTLSEGGDVVVISGNGVETFDPATGQWTLDMEAPPFDFDRHTTTRLYDGRLLVVGGDTPGSPATFFYDPNHAQDVSGWNPAGDMMVGRSEHAAVLLADGQVLVAGGETAEGAQTEIFDPSAPRATAWTPAGELSSRRTDHPLVLLGTGQVLLPGGRSLDATARTELFHPDAPSFTLVPPLVEKRYDMAATSLLDGRAMVAGGRHAGSVAAVEIFDPQTGIWANTTPLSMGSHNRSAVLLPDGDVLVVGPFEAERWDHDADDSVWHLTKPRFTGSADFVAPRIALLPTGEILAVSANGAETYDPDTDTWNLTGPMVTPRRGGILGVLATGEAILAGGQGGPSQSTTLATVEIYDPTTRKWRATTGMSTPRRRHAGTILPSGEFLVAGGDDGELVLARAEVFDPVSETWRSTFMPQARRYAAMAVMASGEVLIVGGDDGTAPLASSHRYDPAANVWRPGPELATARARHAVIKLGTGGVLIVGGRDADDRALGSVERLSIGNPVGMRPEITSASDEIRYGEAFTVTGLRFGGGPETHGGTPGQCAARHPIITLQSVVDNTTFTLHPDRRPANGLLPPTWLDEPMTLTFRALPPGLDPGWHWLTVHRAGLPSARWPISVVCSVAITEPPTDQEGPLDGSVTFEVTDAGGQFYQWRRDGLPIAGATEPSYSTPPLTPDDAGTMYDVVVSNGCTEAISAPATLAVIDTDGPSVTVTVPQAEKLWVMPVEGASAEPQAINWTMSDNIRICRVDVALEYLADDTWLPITTVPNGVVETFDAGTCPAPGLTVQNFLYPLGSSQPSGTDGERVDYRVRVEVEDLAGNGTTAFGPRFTIVEANPDGVRTLIVTNRDRLRRIMAGQLPIGVDIDAEVAALDSDLERLADHDQVNGLVVDLGADGLCETSCTGLEALYAAWDDLLATDPADLDLQAANAAANAVLFDPIDGVHARLLALLDRFTGVEYMVLVGDDRVIPMTRLPDGATLYDETNYLFGNGDDGRLDGLVNRPTSIAAKARLYLSDDPLALAEPPDLSVAEFSLFLPDRAIGRLVEEPADMRRAIQSFLLRDGILVIDDAQADGHHVAVTGYDFLVDAASLIAGQWRQALSDAGVDAPRIDEQIGDAWTEGDLETSLCAATPLMSFNGHAYHYGEGVPSGDQTNILGLDIERMRAPDLCNGHPLDLSGRIIYAVGCHGGLPVEGSMVDADPNHTRDLAQTYLGLGAVAYVANAGYGWGLDVGLGYSERLMEIMTEELTRGGTVAIGQAVATSKLRYFLEAGFLDPYDLKTLMQWTVFGLPMYGVRLTEGADDTGTEPLPPAPLVAIHTHTGHAGEGQELESSVYGGLEGEPLPGLPADLILTELRINIDASNYEKRAANGSVLDHATPCDPDVYDDGCYYALNHLAAARGTGTGDLPLVPYLVYDSRLAGTSQHGVLWKGGTFTEETPWQPVIGTLTSNGGSADVNPLPQHMVQEPVDTHWPLDADDCRPTDLEVNSLSVSVGEVLPGPNDERFGRHRRYDRVDLEIFYLGRESDFGCDRQGPTISDPSGDAFHTRLGANISWQVEAHDPTGVWRVVVVVDDGELDGDKGHWRPLELTRVDGTWRGSLDLPESDRLRYVIQAVDRAGNVNWLSIFESENQESSNGTSGLDLGCRALSGADVDADANAMVPGCLPEVVEVSLDAGPADLDVSLDSQPDTVATSALFHYRVDVHNHGPETASAARLRLTLAPETRFRGFVGEPGWGCDESEPGIVDCFRSFLMVGETSHLQLRLVAPEEPGIVQATAHVTGAGDDAIETNNVAMATTLIVPSGTVDLSVSIDNGTETVLAGAPVTYQVEVHNQGPGSLDALYVLLDTGALQDVSIAATQGDWQGRLWDQLVMAPGDIATLRIDGIAPTDDDELVVSASVWPPLGHDDPNDLDNHATDHDDVIEADVTTVAAFNSVGDTGDRMLDDGETTSTGLTQLLLSLTGPVDSTGQADAFRLVSAGDDGIVSSPVCGPVTEDDSLREITLVEPPSEPLEAIQWTDGQPLPQGHYRFEVCPPLIDDQGLSVADLPWTRRFSLAVSHRLANPNFDQGLDAWTVEADEGAEVRTDPRDAAGAVTSLAARTQGFASGATAKLSQCVAAVPGERLRAGGKALDDLASSLPLVTLSLTAFEATDCQGTPIGTSTVTPFEPTTRWASWSGEATEVPPATASVRVDISVTSIDQQGYVVLLDDLFVYATPPHFEDGFESGDTRAWSVTVP